MGPALDMTDNDLNYRDPHDYNVQNAKDRRTTKRADSHLQAIQTGVAAVPDCTPQGISEERLQYAY